MYVLEAKDLHVKDSFVKLRVGRRKAKTRIMRNSPNPIWNEEFIFKFRDVDDELVVSIYEHSDESNFFHASSGLIGRVRIPIWTVAAEDSQTLRPTWFDIRRSKTEKFINEVAGWFSLFLLFLYLIKYCWSFELNRLVLYFIVRKCMMFEDVRKCTRISVLWRNSNINSKS